MSAGSRISSGRSDESERTLPPPARAALPALSAPGWFGKLASRGDFARRRLPDAWVDRVDRWLAQSLESSRQEMGAQWLDAYLNAAIVRWAFAPGVVDSRWWFGLLMPSCDSVGRYYPLMVAQPCDASPSGPQAWEHLEAWWRFLADAMLDTLAEPSSLEAFETQLALAPALPCGDGGRSALSPQGGGRWRLAPGLGLGQWLAELAAMEWRGRLVNCSLWWPMSAADEAGQLIVVQGLPTQGLLTRLLQPGA
jgi:type VI secretion system protein ImpM